jgi:hypothetical protein
MAQPRTYPLGPDPRLTVTENPVFEFHLALGWVKQAADNVEKKWGDKLGAGGREGVGQIREAVDYLQARWQSWAADRTRDRAYWGRVKADLYYRSLQGYQRRLKEVLRSSDVGEVEQAITEVAADMRLKASNCEHSDDGLGKSIAVRVRTLQGTDEVAGYEVWCVPRALVGFKDSHLRFPQVSSPATIPNLSPGNYLLWVRKDGATSEQIPQTIGGEGQKEAEVEILVP